MRNSPNCKNIQFAYCYYIYKNHKTSCNCNEIKIDVTTIWYNISKQSNVLLQSADYSIKTKFVSFTLMRFESTVLTDITLLITDLSVDILARLSTLTKGPIHVISRNFCRLDISSPVCSLRYPNALSSSTNCCLNSSNEVPLAEVVIVGPSYLKTALWS